ncbi:MAG: enolase C-terminal domain-like protein [Alphaproteobacteria bacterium]
MSTTYDELNNHVVERVNTYKVRSIFPRLVGKNAFRPEHSFGDEFIVKELVTNKGAMGWGVGNGLFYRPDLSVDNLVIGKRVSQLIDPSKGILSKTLSTFDFALHDLAGVILNIPAYKMFGGQGVNPVPVYDTLIYFDDISPDRRPGGVKRIIEECQFGYDYGYRAFKLKIGRAPLWMNWDDGLKRDIEVTRLVRKHFPDCAIMVDGNDAFPLDKMLEYVSAVGDVGLYWIEEPFREDRENFARLREHLDKVSPATLIADGETDPDFSLLVDLYDEGLLGVLQMDISGDESLAHSFGLTPWRQVMPQLSSMKARISPHTWGLKLKTHYAVSFCAGYPGITYVEGITDVTEGVDFEGYVLKNGLMAPPERPGFGMDFIWGMAITGENTESKSIWHQVKVFPQA